ncbi:MAG: GNAT family N-acetyltransferase [Pseudomonadota bacterium]
MTIRIETERLILRPMEARDVEPHIAMMLDPETARYLTPDGAPRARADEWRSVASYLGHWQIRGFGFFSVEEKETGEWVGRVGPWMPEGWPALECGWSIVSSRRGKGYAPEAAIAAVRWIFAQFPDLDRIISVIDPTNVNSQAVARKIGEENSGEIFEFWGFRLDIWSADRKAWLDRFGGS